MNSYLLDTTICSAILNKKPQVVSRFNITQGCSLIHINFYVYAELMYLIENSTYKDFNRLEIDRLLRDVTIFQSDEGTSKTYAKLKARLRKKFAPRNQPPQQEFDPQIIGFKDRHLWLIATTLRYRATLVSSDKIFNNERIREVAKFKLENWLTSDIEDLEDA